MEAETTLRNLAGVKALRDLAEEGIWGCLPGGPADRRLKAALLAGAEALEALSKLEDFLQREGPLQLHLGWYMHSATPGLAVAKGIAHAVRNWPLPTKEADRG